MKGLCGTCIAAHDALLKERMDSATALTTALHELALALAMATMVGSDTIELLCLFSVIR